MYSISKTWAWSAAHCLEGLREGHPCSRMHGHNYEVTLTIDAHALDDNGFVIDYGELAPFGTWMDMVLDHRTLNDYEPQPTAENLARDLHTEAGNLLDLWDDARVIRWTMTVSETPRTTATYTEPRNIEGDL